MTTETPKAITREVVDWVNEQARRIRASGSMDALIEAYLEIPRRFPHIRGMVVALLVSASGQDTPLEWRPEPDERFVPADPDKE